MMLSASVLITSRRFTELGRKPFASYEPRLSKSVWKPTLGSLRDARRGIDQRVGEVAFLVVPHPGQDLQREQLVV
jgi:hypothetical protein